MREHDDDMLERFFVQMSKKSLQPTDRIPAYIQSVADDASDEQIAEMAEVSEYKTAVSTLLNDKEDSAALERYKSAVRQLLLASQAPCATESL